MNKLNFPDDEKAPKKSKKCLKEWKLSVMSLINIDHKNYVKSSDRLSAESDIKCKLMLWREIIKVAQFCNKIVRNDTYSHIVYSLIIQSRLILLVSSARNAKESLYIYCLGLALTYFLLLIFFIKNVEDIQRIRTALNYQADKLFSAWKNSDGKLLLDVDSVQSK